MQIRKRSDMLKFEVLHETTSALKRNSKEIRFELNNISERLEKI
jgi:hypothetical protein